MEGRDAGVSRGERGRVMATTVRWSENDTERTAGWRSENGAVPPRDIVVVDDNITADSALRMARSGVGLLWRGDFHNARQLLRALDKRLERRVDRKASRAPRNAEPGKLFHANRLARSQRAAILGKILIELEPDHTIQLRRAPEVRDACAHAYGDPAGDREATVVSLPEILGVISAYQWHQTGIEVSALGERIHPAYGVFAPTRDEYIDLVAAAPWPDGVDQPVVFDIGTGTGVLAALLARRGAGEVVATDVNPRAVQCAVDNMKRLGAADRVRVEEADLWPAHPQRADVVVCNPPWIPGRPTSALEQGIYDRNSDVLLRFLGELPQHLAPGGQGWLILSDLAEHLELRTREEFLARIEAAGLIVVGTQETTPSHPRAAEEADPLHVARSRERTTLWRLGVSPRPARVHL